MSTRAAEHPSAEQLRAYTQGRLRPADSAVIEEHVLACEACCRALECVPADSFEERLRGAERAAFATTTDGSSPTLADPPGVPPELADHPRYRVLGLVGQGGMGAVYRAEHRKMDRQVALKVINPALLRNPATVSRFQQEAKAAAKLDHANIVRAYDADQAGELHFLVMEFVEGTSLAEVVAARGPLPVAEACGYARQAALGLQHAHDRGTVHRDIKPHNLMLTPDGAVKILDFGLARFAHATDEVPVGGPQLTSSLTTAGAVMGTADYIAPEQVADARRADIRADVYALGCTLFHLLAGRPPFPEGTNADKFKHHAETPLPIPNEWPDQLKAVLRKMTAKRPEDRYATPAEVTAALEPLARVAPAKPRRRRWLVAAALALLALVAAVVVIRVRTDDGREVVVTTDDPNLEIVTKKGGQIVRVRDPKTDQTWELDTRNLTMRDLEHPDGFTITLDGRGELTFKSGGGKVTVAVGKPPAGGKNFALEDGNYRILDAKPVLRNDPAELAKLPNAADALKPSDIPEIARAYVGRGDPVEIPPELVAVLGDVRFRVSESRGPMAISPDGKQLAVADDRKDEVRIFDAQSGRLLGHFSGGHVLRYKMAFSPDGKRLAGTTVGGEFNVFDAETGRLIWTRPSVNGSGVDLFTFTADGKSIYVSRTPDTVLRKNAIEQLEAETGARKQWWPVQDRLTDFAVSPDGTKLVEVPIGSGHTRLRDLKTAEGTTFTNLGVDGSRAAFSPDGKRFVTACTGYDGKWRVAIHDAKGDVLHVLPDAGLRLPSAVFAPDGKTLTTVGIDGTVHIDRWAVATGKKLSSWTPLGGELADYVLSPDGATLALRRKDVLQVELYDAATGKPRHTSAGPAAPVLAVAFSPDGKYLAAADRSGTRLWDLAATREAAVWDKCGGQRLAFSPDGKLLARGTTTHVCVHRVPDGHQLLTLEAKSTAVESLVFSPDGATVAATGGGDDVRVWRVSDGKELRVLSYPRHARAVTFTPDGSKVVATGAHGIRVWDANTGLEIKHFLWESICRAPEWLPDGKTLAVTAASTSGGGVWHVDPVSGAVVKKLSGVEWGPEVQAFGPGARFICQSSDGSFLLAQLAPEPVRKRLLRLSPATASAVAFSPDRRYLACGSAEGVISLLRLSEKGKVPELQVLPPTARELAERANAADALKHADVTEQERAFAAGGDPKQAPPELVGVLGETRFRGAHDDRYDGPRALRYSPDGKLLAALTLHGGIDLYDVATGRVALSFRGEQRFSDIAFAPDGARAAVATLGGIEVWDVRAGKRLHNFKSPVDSGTAFECVAFSPDGKQVAFVTHGKSVSVIDLATGEMAGLADVPKRTVAGGTAPVPISRLEFTPDGKKVLVQRGASAEALAGSTDLIDLATGRLAPLPFDAPELWFGAGGKLVAARRDELVAFDADGKPHRRVAIPGAPAAHVTPAGHVFFVRREDGLWNQQLVVRRGSVADPANQAQFTLNLLGPPTAWAVAPDGKTVAVAVDGRLLRFFDIAPPKTAPAPTEPPGGKLPPVEELKLFAKESREDRPHPGHVASPRAAAWSADGKLLATADEHSVLVWDVAEKRVLREFGSLLEIRQVRALAFSPDGGTLAVSYGADDQPVIELWHLAGDRLGSAARGQRFKGHAKPVTALAFSPDGSLLATASHDHTARVFRAKDGTPVHALALNEEVRSVAFTPSGAELITREWGGRARVWDVRTGTAIRSWEVKTDGRIVTERFLPDGRTLRLLIDSPSGVSFQDWDWTTGGFVREQVVERHQALRDAHPALAPGGGFVAYTSEGAGGALLVRDTASDRRKTLLVPDTEKQWAARRPLFSPDGRYLVTGGPDGLVAIFRLSDRGQLPDVRPPGDPEELARRPNAADALKHSDVPEVARAYAGGGDPKLAPKELVAVSGDVRFRCPPSAGGPVFSSDGKLLAVSGPKTVALFDAAGWLVRELPGVEDGTVAFSPDGTRVAAGGRGGKVVVWATATGREERTLDATRMVHGAAFTPDGKYLATADDDGNVRLWDLATGAPKRKWTLHKGRWSLAAVARPDADDGKQLLAAACDGSDVYFFSDFAEWANPPFSRPGEKVALAPGGARQAIYRFVPLAEDRRHELIFVEGDALKDARHKRAEVTSVPYHLAFADAKTLVSVGRPLSGELTLTRWDAVAGTALTTVKLERLEGPGQFALSPDGKTLAARLGDEGVVRTFDAVTGKQRLPDSGHAHPVTALAWSPDGTRLLAANARGFLLRDLATGKVVKSYGPGGLAGVRVAYRPDGQQFVTVEDEQGATRRTTISLWSKDGDWQHRLTRFEVPVIGFAFTPDGHHLAIQTRDRTLSVWNVAERKEVRLLRCETGSGFLVFSPDGKEFATLDGSGRVHFYDAQTGKLRAGFASGTERFDDPYHLEFSPDGRTFKVGILTDAGRTAEMHLRSVVTGDSQRPEDRTPMAVGKWSLSPVASPAGRLVAWDDYVGGLHLWQPGEPHRRTVLRVPRRDGVVSAQAFSPDGRYLACADAAGVVMVFRLAERGRLPVLPDVEAAPMPRRLEGKQ